MNLQSIRDLIFSIDNSEGILDYELPDNYSCWLLIRYEIYQYLLNRYVYKFDSNSIKGSKKLLIKIRERIVASANGVRYLIYSFYFRPRALKESIDCLNYTSSYGTFLNGSGYINKSTGFLEDCDNISTANLIFVHNYRYLRNYRGNSYYIDYLFFINDLKVYLFRNRASKNIDNILANFENHLTKYLKEYIDANIISDFIKNLYSCYLRIYWFQKDIQKIVNTGKVKLFLIEDANYGGWHTSVIINVCRRYKVKTAEMQHGIFDIAYQYGEDLLKNEKFSEHKPDYLFTYGKYFSNYSKTSGLVVEMGNYFLDRKKEEIIPSTSDSKYKKILFIAQRNYTDRILPTISKCLEKLDFNFKLIIRLHPSGNDRSAYSELIDKFNPLFSANEDLYDLLNTADFIIGLHSAVLIESFYFKKRIFIYDNEMSRNNIPSEIGQWFKNEDELLEHFKSINSVSNDGSFYFRENTVLNFEAFWKEYMTSYKLENQSV